MKRERLIVALVLAAAVIVPAAVVASSHGQLAVGSAHTTNSDFQSGTIGGIATVSNGDINVEFGEQQTVATFVDSNSNLKYVDQAGDVTDLGVQAQGAGGIADIDGDGVSEVAFVEDGVDSNIKYIEISGGSATDTGADAGGYVSISDFGDFDGDGDLDVAYPTSQSAIGYVDASGNTGSVAVDLGGQIGGMGDMDGDGDLDIGLIHLDGYPRYIDSGGSMSSSFGYGALSMGDIGDFDDDGTAELVYRNPITHIEADGSITQTSIGAGEVGGLGDLDGDGATDVLFTQNDVLRYTDAGGSNVSLGVNTLVPGYIGETVFPNEASYVSATHSVERAEQAFVDVSISNAEADVRWEYYDGSSWQTAASATYTTSGNHTLDVSGHPGATQWRLDVTFRRQSGAGSVTLHDEGVQFFNRAPSVDNASATPTGDLTSQSNYEIDVSDATFPLAQGDTVTAELFVDGSAVGSDTLTSNGTASVAHTISAGGTHSYHWEVTDSAGSTQTSQTYSVNVPSTLYLYNESNPDQLIQGTTDIRIRLFGQGEGSNTVIERTVSDGTLDLGSIPADQRYVISLADETDSYYYRRVILDSIYDQQSVYLLPQSQPAVSVEFAFQDYSGNYPPAETYFYISKAIRKDFDGDGDNETRYQTVAGDVVGPTGSYPATLQRNERYRLRIRNDPNQRLLGAFTATANEIEEITIRGLELRPPDGSRYAALRSIERGPNGKRLLTFKYRDPAPSQTSALDVWVRYQANDSIVYEDHVVDVKNYSAYDIPLANDTAYVLEYNATIDGETESSSIPIGYGAVGVQIPLDPTWLGGVVLVGLVFLMALGGRRKFTYIANTVVVMAAVAMYLGVAEISLPLWWLAVVISVGAHLRVMQTPRTP